MDEKELDRVKVARTNRLVKKAEATFALLLNENECDGALVTEPQDT